MSMVPGVIHRDKNGNERLIDIGTKLLMNRIILCTGEVTDELAESVVAQLLYLEAEDKEKPIKMLVAGPGGSVIAGNQIISTMHTISCPVHTFAMGCVASMSALITISGEKGQRAVYPNTEIMLHTVASGTQGKIQDMEISLENVRKTNERCMKQIAEACGKTIEEVKKDCDRDFWMDENEALAYGAIDKIVERHKK